MKDRYSWPVNWKDGMKINSSHFEAERRYVQSLSKVYGGIHIYDHNFGLISDDEQDDMRYSILSDSLSIEQYFGISRRGQSFYINEDNCSSIEKLDLKKLKMDYVDGEVIQIYIKANLDKHASFGNIDNEEFPVRYPHATIEYSLTHMRSDLTLKVSSLDMLVPVIRLIKNGDSLTIDDNYIAPAVSNYAHRKLRDRHHQLAHDNFKLASYNSEIAQKISAKPHGSFLESNIKILSTQMAFFIANYLDEFNDTYLYKSPKEIVVFYKRMNRIINACLISMQNKEQTIQYMGKWAGMPVQAFLDSLDAMNNMKYDHLNIDDCLSKVENYVNMINGLFGRLKELNYMEV